MTETIETVNGIAADNNEVKKTDLKWFSKKKKKSENAPDEPLKSKVPKDVVDKSADAVETIEWVAKHLDVRLSQPILKTAPCPEAISMLNHYRQDKYRPDFWDKLYSKLVPSRAQMSNRKVIEFDGKHVTALINHTLSLLERAKNVKA